MSTATPLSRFSRTQLAVLLEAAAIALSVLPFFQGIGLLWSLVMLALGLLVFVEEQRASGQPLPPWLHWVEQLPPEVWNPSLHLVFTLLTLAHAVQQFGIGLTPPLWLLAAWLAGSEQVRRRLAVFPAGDFSWASVRSGPRLGVLVALGVCLLAFQLPWVKHGGYYRGAIESRYVSEDPDLLGDVPYAGRWRNDYNPVAWYVPEFRYSGRTRQASIAALCALFLLAGSMLFGRRPPEKFPELPVALAAGLSIWWFVVMGNAVGCWLFLAGLVGLDVLAVRQYLAHKARPTG
ncbi:hypothetical protein [Archangium lansingense]|uniref:Uncharacterized protein n=1 Tax=Archangium lansingense TaxID=2995310 RepID=A0ABT4A206_9BACT|nr:hypothetical protein [Archangium lansinium]MCY1075304.1 hypothetical protein [Archangium lansinium]